MSKEKPKKFQKKSNSQLVIAVRQFRRNKLAMLGLIVFLLMIVVCVFADYLTPYEYDKSDLLMSFAPISWAHPMGTDQMGRDLLTRLLKGGQVSLMVALFSVAVSATMGTALGCSAAYFGGIYETVVMRIMDIFMSMPALLLATAVATALGTGIINSVIAIAIASLASITRIMHSTALTVKNQEYLEAASADGASRLRCIFKYVVPNCMASLFVMISMRFGTGITQVASLSFLGLGVLPPTPEWGSILNSGRAYIRSYWPIIVFPGIFISITLICVNFIGDGLRDAFDPKLKR